MITEVEQPQPMARLDLANSQNYDQQSTAVVSMPWE